MAKPVLKIQGYQPEDIKALLRKDERYTIGLRLYAIYQVSLGQPSRKLEELYNTSFKQITNWVHRFEQEGIEGLKDKRGRGRKSKLDEEQLERIKQLLLNESPIDFGFNTATWTGPLVIDWIRKYFGLEYKKAQIYNILKSLGFSYQKEREYSRKQAKRSRKPLKKG
ncbi:transposase [Niabella ginsenosidivorans]|uniref:Transposase n=1 Tax=Niabella ginsenosidivorans TaxID=1176587 RepID=A0A1A9I525_9BACT|nr:helix-turn-helix domain-containing protein [Niabella ginsenosidivorans]ANH81771.1 transposase [Niabella ginsenosidivorans]